MKLEATKNYRYNNRMLVAGEPFTAMSRQDYRTLIALKRARPFVEQAGPVSPKTETTAPQVESTPPAEEIPQESEVIPVQEVTENVVEETQEAPAPRRRGRPRKNPDQAE